MMTKENHKRVRKGAAIVATLFIVSACGEDTTAPSGPTLETIAKAEQLTPSDPAFAEIYETTCKACHANPDTGAPLTGDAQAWAPRIAKGSDVLLDNTIDGFKGMPPLGLCMDCTADEFAALIEFMTTAE